MIVRPYTGDTGAPNERPSLRTRHCSWTSELFSGTGHKPRSCCFMAFPIEYITVNTSFNVCFTLCALCHTIVYFRNFRLRLRRDTTGFTEPFEVFSENTSSTADLSHLYSGELEGIWHFRDSWLYNPTYCSLPPLNLPISLSPPSISH